MKERNDFEKVNELLKVLYKLYRRGKRITDETIDETIEDIKKSSGIELDTGRIYKMAKNYQVKKVNIISLEDIIDWFKDNDVPRMKKGVYKAKESEDGRIVIYLFFIDTEGAVLDGELPVGVIYALKLDNDLKEFFNKNEFLILNM